MQASRNYSSENWVFFVRNVIKRYSCYIKCRGAVWEHGRNARHITDFTSVYLTKSDCWIVLLKLRSLYDVELVRIEGWIGNNLEGGSRGVFQGTFNGIHLYGLRKALFTMLRNPTEFRLSLLQPARPVLDVSLVSTGFVFSLCTAWWLVLTGVQSVSRSAGPLLAPGRVLCYTLRIWWHAETYVVTHFALSVKVHSSLTVGICSVLNKFLLPLHTTAHSS